MSAMNTVFVKSDPEANDLSDSLYPTDIEVKVEPGDSSVNTNRNEGFRERYYCFSRLDRQVEKRHSIGGQRVVGESAAVNVGEVEKWKEKVLTPLLPTYTYDDIFNMDETGLFYKLMVDKTLHFKGEKCSGGKLSKERLTVALCANMSGTEKEVPIVIGKFGKPRCFNTVTNLPCQYYHKKKVWMVSDIFQAWVRDFDRRMTRKNRKVLLIIDNCPSHPTMNRLMSIRLLFTPPNTTSVLQPMDQGIIRIFKSYYRQQVLRFTVDYIDTYGKKPVVYINVLQAIRWVHKAWYCVTKETIARCFHHGLGHTNLDQTDVTSTVDDNEEGDTVRNLNLLLHTIDPTSNVTANELLAVDADVTVAEHLSDAEIVQPEDLKKGKPLVSPITGSRTIHGAFYSTVRKLIDATGDDKLPSNRVGTFQNYFRLSKEKLSFVLSKVELEIK
ncbi:tigger transposable element-derived protein 6-like [Watersipora subatra]|uniref:tigger transposable element-derived protein 6-like n=1 Tax=Watersipora subatra TaxID=2589382 RepID=UPI00355AE92B